jgi:hypothetical protein
MYPHAYVITMDGAHIVVSTDDYRALIQVMAICDECFFGDDIFEALRKGALSVATDYNVIC